MKEIIDDFLLNEKKTCSFLDKLVEKYKLSDFVMVNSAIKEYLAGGEIQDIEKMQGCICLWHEKQFNLEFDSVERRLNWNYLDFLWMVLQLKEKDKVRYILAYHYLYMISQLAFQLAITSNAPFDFSGMEMSPLGEERYALYEEVRYGKIHDIVPYISKASLVNYYRIFYQYGREHHSVKHYSLLEYILRREDTFKTDWELEKEFVDMLDIFLFRYKAIFSTELPRAYVNDLDREKIINSLVEI